MPEVRWSVRDERREGKRGKDTEGKGEGKWDKQRADVRGEGERGIGVGEIRWEEKLNIQGGDCRGKETYRW